MSDSEDALGPQPKRPKLESQEEIILSDDEDHEEQERQKVQWEINKVERLPHLPQSEHNDWIFPTRPGRVTGLDVARYVNEKRQPDGAGGSKGKVCSPNLSVIGHPHPSSLWESIAARTVPLPPLPEDLSLRIPYQVLEKKRLSQLQLETISYAVARLNEADPLQRGYLLGDGTGSGKGRTIAAIILHYWNCGLKKHIWFSTSRGLIEDATRDFRDLCGVTEQVVAAAGGAGDGGDELPFEIYDVDTLVQRWKEEKNRLPAHQDPHLPGVLFLSYHKIARGSDDVSILKTWFRKQEGVLAFDEAHRAKNLQKNTATGREVRNWQTEYAPNARVIYASATAATELSNLAYMTRAGLWGKDEFYRTFDKFSNSIRDYGVTGMEMIAMNLRAYGLMSCKSLSYEGCDFELVKSTVSKKMRTMYDATTEVVLGVQQELWDALQTAADEVSAHIRAGRGLDAFRNTYESEDPEMRRPLSIAYLLIAVTKHLFVEPKAGEERDEEKLLEKAWGLANMYFRMIFWGFQQRFYKQLLVSMKVEKAVELCKEALKEDEQVVFSMWMTMEGRIKGDGLAARSGAVRADGAGDVGADDDEFEFERLDADDVIDLESDGSEAGLEEGNASSPIDDAAKESGVSGAEEVEEAQGGANAVVVAEGDAPPQNDARPEVQQPRARSAREELAGLELSLRHGIRRCLPWLPDLQTIEHLRPILYNDSAGGNPNGGDNNAAPQQTDVKETALARDVKKLLNARARFLKSARDIKLPPNPLDNLIEKLGGPSFVAEISGRIHRQVRRGNKVAWEKRLSSDNDVAAQNLEEKDSFQRGDKRIAIITEAGSTGISLHAENRDLRHEPHVMPRRRSSFSVESAGASGLGAVDAGKNASTANYKNELVLMVPGSSSSSSGAEAEGRDGHDGHRNVAASANGTGLAQPVAVSTVAHDHARVMVPASSSSSSSSRSAPALRQEAEQAQQQAQLKLPHLRRRRMITLELPWAADKAIQQFGRVHRSNQAQAPRYQLVTTPVNGEVRFSSAIARKMRLLGAVTKADRHSSMGNCDDVDEIFAEFDVSNQYGMKALELMLEDFDKEAVPDVRADVYRNLDCWPNSENNISWETRFFQRCKDKALRMGLFKMRAGAGSNSAGGSKGGGKKKKEKGAKAALEEAGEVNQFLNRILMLPLKSQDEIFQVFAGIALELIRKDKEAETYTDGLETVNNQLQSARVEKEEEVFTDPKTGAKTMLTSMRIDQGLKWKQVWDRMKSGAERFAKVQESRRVFEREFSERHGPEGQYMLYGEDSYLQLQREEERRKYEGFYLHQPGNLPKIVKDQGYFETLYLKWNAVRGFFDVWLPHRGVQHSFLTRSKVSPREIQSWMQHTVLVKALTVERFANETPPKLPAAFEFRSRAEQWTRWVTDQEFKTAWARQFEASETQCIHLQRGMQCRSETLCRNGGMRIRHIRVLSGAFLKVWGLFRNALCEVVASDGGDSLLVASERVQKNKIKPPKLLRVRLQGDSDVIGLELRKSNAEKEIRETIKKFRERGLQFDAELRGEPDEEELPQVLSPLDLGLG